MTTILIRHKCTTTREALAFIGDVFREFPPAQWDTHLSAIPYRPDPSVDSRYEYLLIGARLSEPRK